MRRELWLLISFVALFCCTGRTADAGHVPATQPLPDTFCHRSVPPSPIPGLPVIHRMPINGRIEKGDLLEIVLPDWVGPNMLWVRRVRVAEDGTASLLLFKLKLAGLLPDEAPRAIIDACISHFVEFTGTSIVNRIETAADSPVRLGPLRQGDLIEMSLSDVEGPNVTSDHYVRIEDDGTIPVPLLGAVKVAGQVESDAEDFIRDKYRDANLITNAGVEILKVQDAEKVRVKAGPVQKGDLLRVTLTRLEESQPETTLDVRVGQDGNVGLPRIGGIKLAGRSVPDAIGDIVAAYEKHKIAQYMNVWLLRIESPDQASLPLGPIQPGDLLNVYIGGTFSFGGSPWNRPARVSEAGTISLPYVSKLKVAGLTELQAQEEIAKALPELFRKAVVSVLRLERQ